MKNIIIYIDDSFIAQIYKKTLKLKIQISSNVSGRWIQILFCEGKQYSKKGGTCSKNH